MAAVLSAINVSVSNPFSMASQKPLKASISPPQATSSRLQQPSTSSNISTASASPEPRQKTFKRIRSTLEQSLRTATRSKAKSPLPPVEVDDEFGTVTQQSQTKVKAPEVAPKEKSRPTVFRKVTFSKPNHEPTHPPAPSKESVPPPTKEGKRTGRMAGFTSFMTPSLREASVSTPALHLHSQPLPSPKSQPAAIASSSSTTDALTSPVRERSRRAAQISGPVPLAPKRDGRSNGHALSSSPPVPREQPRHRATQSVPTVSIPSSTAFPSPRSPSTPIKIHRSDLPSPPTTPTPGSRSRSPLTHSSSRIAALSSGHLPLSSSPTTPTAIRARSPSTRTRVVSPSTPRGMTSSSASHLPLPSSPSPTPKARRPSIDDPPRPSFDGARRPSMDSPRRPSFDITPRPSLDSRRPSEPISTSDSRANSPVRARARSPSQRTYAQNRHFNISTSSLCLPATPEQRELLRSATSMLCKEMQKPSPNLSRTEAGQRELEEIDHRMRPLIRLERIWGKSLGATGSSTQLQSSTAITSGGEERERKVFCEAIRDGYVLCQLMNKVRSSSAVKPDSREDGFVRTSNVTKFLAACSSYGLGSEDLFQRDDLIEATSESLARVSHTIITLIKFADSPAPDRVKVLTGQGKPHGTSPYSGNPAVSRAASSTPNFSSSNTPTSPVRKRWSPPSELPTVRSDSPNESSGNSANDTEREGDRSDQFGDEQIAQYAAVPKLLSPPPRSPLRARSPKVSEETRAGDPSLLTLSSSPSRASVADSTRASVGTSVRESFSESIARQSMASTVMSDTTTYSSLLDARRSNSNYGNNKYGTIRTVTTEATSEMPSFGRADGSSIAASLADDYNGQRRVSDPTSCKPMRERRMSETAQDLGRVVEEVEDSSKGMATNGNGNAKPPAIFLGKGKWPDDFMDMRTDKPSRPIPIPNARQPPPEPLSESPSSMPTPTSSIITNGPRKLAIVGASRRNDSVEGISQFPRRPSHRARHSIDSPALLPKEAVLRRDTSPDGIPKIAIRRHSSKPAPRNNVYAPRSSSREDNLSSGDGDSPVPFPRQDGSHGSPPNTDGLPERPRLMRGRFQSEVDGASTRRKPRPSSYDDAGARPTRSRFESMVNLGVSNSNEKASDILSNASDPIMVRRTLIVREEGKISTHYQLGNAIGRGQFGTVYRALNLNTGQMVAVKRIPLDGLKEEEITQLMKEVDLVKSLSHPSIVKYEGMARDDDTLSIVLEYAENGSLGQTLKAFGKLNERLVASYVVKILEGLHYLHCSDVVHCDLKAANILTTKNGNVKLSDFGVSLNMRAMERQVNNVAGTPNWMAPEVIELKGASPKSDIWSLGCTVIELLTGRPPYADLGGNTMSVMYAIVENETAPIPDGCSPLLEDFLQQCFDKNPTKRPDAETLCEHPWLKKNWLGNIDLRPQDSIPFLRRVSADIQKSDAVRLLAQMEAPDNAEIEEQPLSSSPPRQRLSSSSRPPPNSDNDMSPRDHSFVKTTFSKPMVCRVCLLNVKKSAVLCAQCSLIAHSRCAPNAPPTCDLRAQLLLYAQYAEKGNPSSAYTNPIDALHDALPRSPTSDVSYIAGSPRTSLDVPSSSTPIPPPTAFKFMAAFKRSRSNLGGDSQASGSSTSVLPQDTYAQQPQPQPQPPPAPPPVRNKIRKRESRERPNSITSNSTQGNSSMRSAATAQESFSSRQGTGQQSLLSAAEAVAKSRASDFSHAGDSKTPAKVVEEEERIPGHLPTDTRRHKRGKDSKSSGNCSVQ